MVMFIGTTHSVRYYNELLLVIDRCVSRTDRGLLDLTAYRLLVVAMLLTAKVEDVLSVATRL